MSQNSNIEWTDATWNPVTGCTRVSTGCKHCYAEVMAKRLMAMGQDRYRNGFRVTLQPDLLTLPLRWRKPRLVFVNSMSDLFHEAVPDPFIQQVFDVMARASRHTFQVLTKRSKRLRELAPRLPWAENVWMGVSVENAAQESRVWDLLEVPAAVRWLSMEPLLAAVDPARWLGDTWSCPVCEDDWRESEQLAGPEVRWCGLCATDNGREVAIRRGAAGLHWIVVGGESGPGARPLHPAWVRRIRDRCQRAGVPFFLKQWGAWWPVAEWVEGEDEPGAGWPGTLCGDPGYYDRVRVGDRWRSACLLSPEGQISRDLDSISEGDAYVARVGKGHAGRKLDGRTWDELPARTA